MKYINSLTTRSETFKTTENWLTFGLLFEFSYSNFHFSLILRNEDVRKKIGSCLMAGTQFFIPALYLIQNYASELSLSWVSNSEFSYLPCN